MKCIAVASAILAAAGLSCMAGPAATGEARPSQPDWTSAGGAEIHDGLLVIDVPPGERREGFAGVTAEVPMRGLRDFWMTVGFRRERAPEECATNEPPCRVRFDATVKERGGATHVRATKWAKAATATNAIPADTLVTRVWCLKLGELEESMTVVAGVEYPSGRHVFDLASFRVVDLRAPCRGTGGIPLRGVMLPPQPLSEKAFDTLAEWGVSLVRFQIVKDGSATFDIRDMAAYITSMGNVMRVILEPEHDGDGSSADAQKDNVPAE